MWEKGCMCESLENISTKRLVEELMSRTGHVSFKYVDPYEKDTLFGKEIEGPCIILEVID